VKLSFVRRTPGSDDIIHHSLFQSHHVAHAVVKVVNCTSVGNFHQVHSCPHTDLLISSLSVVQYHIASSYVYNHHSVVQLEAIQATVHAVQIGIGHHFSIIVSFVGSVDQLANIVQ
jgi:hypothetical protein